MAALVATTPDPLGPSAKKPKRRRRWHFAGSMYSSPSTWYTIGGASAADPSPSFWLIAATTVSITLASLKAAMTTQRSLLS
jgi:hypothetical protein